MLVHLSKHKRRQETGFSPNLNGFLYQVLSVMQLLATVHYLDFNQRSKAITEKTNQVEFVWATIIEF